MVVLDLLLVIEMEDELLKVTGPFQFGKLIFLPYAEYVKVWYGCFSWSSILCFLAPQLMYIQSITFYEALLSS
jgi:hypothetical protein